MNFRKSRFVGCLLGKAIGDAVGAPVEFKGPEECQQYINEHIRPLNFEGVIREYEGPFLFGQYTDDTQFARELTLSLVACGGSLEPEDYAQRLLKLKTQGHLVGSGRATAKALQKLEEGVAWNASGTPAPAAGNGSAMRVAPLGLTYIDRWEEGSRELVFDARDQSIITHSDPRSVAGSVLMTGATALLVSEVSPEEPFFTQQLSEWTYPFDPILAEVVVSLPSLVGLSIEEAYAKLQRVGVPEKAKSIWDPGVSPFVTTSVLWSLYAFLRTPDDFVETLCTAIWPGGDVDTTAAMAGALGGVWNGLETFPPELLSPLTDQGSWNTSDLIELALNLEELC